MDPTACHKDLGRGTSHKYARIHDFYSVKYDKHFTKTVLQIIFTRTKIQLRSKRSVYVGIFFGLFEILRCHFGGLSHRGVNC